MNPLRLLLAAFLAAAGVAMLVVLVAICAFVALLTFGIGFVLTAVVTSSFTAQFFGGCVALAFGLVAIVSWNA